MKKLLIAAAAAAVTLAAPQAFAQAKNFEGFSVQGGLNAAASTFEQITKSSGASASATSSSSNFQLQADYTFAVTEKVTVGVGATVGLGDLVFGRWASSGAEIKLKNTNALYVAPGFAISDTALVYGKIASVSGTAYDNSGSLDINGMGYGLGARFLSGKNIYYQVEFMQNQYSDKDLTTVTDKFKTSVFNVGIGYKF